MTDPKEAFIREAMPVISTLLSWREGPRGEVDEVWEHNDREVWGRLAALLPKANAALAADPSGPAQADPREDTVARAIQDAIAPEEAEGDMLAADVLARAARAALAAAVRTQGPDLTREQAQAMVDDHDRLDHSDVPEAEWLRRFGAGWDSLRAFLASGDEK